MCGVSSPVVVSLSDTHHAIHDQFAPGKWTVHQQDPYLTNLQPGLRVNVLPLRESVMADCRQDIRIRKDLDQT